MASLDLLIYRMSEGQNQTLGFDPFSLRTLLAIDVAWLSSVHVINPGRFSENLEFIVIKVQLALLSWGTQEPICYLSPNEGLPCPNGIAEIPLGLLT